MTTLTPKYPNKSLSAHTFTYFYKCSDKTYYGLFQYLAEKPDCNFKKHRKKKKTKKKNTAVSAVSKTYTYWGE